MLFSLLGPLTAKHMTEETMTVIQVALLIFISHNCNLCCFSNLILNSFETCDNDIVGFKVLSRVSGGI